MQNEIVDSKEMLQVGGGRKSWIDLCKGILILLVVFFHESRQGLSEVELDSEVLRNATRLEFMYVPFFMSAFFLISGYCSNFDKDFKSFFISNFKGLILQSFSIALFAGLLLFIITWNSASFHIGLSPSFKSGGLLWFTIALFEAKIIFWLQKKYLRRHQYILLSNIFFIIVGSMLTHLGYKEYLNIYHAFALVPFIQIGFFIKDQYLLSKKLLLNSIICLFIGILMYMLLGVRISLCSIIGTWMFEPLFIPLFLLLSIPGCILVLILSKFIESSSFFVFYGKDSLAIYILHLIIWPQLLSYIGRPLCSLNLIFQVFYFIVLFFVCIAICGLFVRLINIPYVRIVKLDFRDFSRKDLNI